MEKSHPDKVAPLYMQALLEALSTMVRDGRSTLMTCVLIAAGINRTPELPELLESERLIDLVFMNWYGLFFWGGTSLLGPDSQSLTPLRRNCYVSLLVLTVVAVARKWWTVLAFFLFLSLTYVASNGSYLWSLVWACGDMMQCD